MVPEALCLSHPPVLESPTHLCPQPWRREINAWISKLQPGGSSIAAKPWTVFFFGGGGGGRRRKGCNNFIEIKSNENLKGSA